MKTIYNEGRVVGLSAYELYVRQLLSEDPDAEPLTEREWLGSTLGSGASMILYVKAGTTAGVHDYVLPRQSRLVGCSTLIGSIFDGIVSVGTVFEDSDCWAIRVDDYGLLIDNERAHTPGQPEDVPTHPIDSSNPKVIDMRPSFAKSCVEYTKLISGIMIQPGEWITNELAEDLVDEQERQNLLTEDDRILLATLRDKTAGQVLVPDLNERGFIRLRFSADIENDMLIMLTGLLNKDLVSGYTGFDNILDTDHYFDGDFLGPVSFPWATRIVFVQSNDYSAAVNSKAYVRKLPANAQNKSVTSKPILDFDEVNFSNYDGSASKVPVKVTDVNAVDGVNVLTLFQRKDVTSGGYSGASFNPVLYASHEDSSGDSNICPVDVAAPGSVKVIEDNETKATAYPKVLPGTFAIYKNTNEHIFLIDSEGHKIDLSSSLSVTSANALPIATVTSGDHDIETISLSNSLDGARLNLAGTSTVDLHSNDTISWQNLLNALSNQQNMNLFGQHLNYIKKNSTSSTVKATTGNYLETNNIQTHSNYIEFNATGTPGQGKRLYISSTAPTGSIPEGSLGIGW